MQELESNWRDGYSQIAGAEDAVKARSQLVHSEEIAIWRRFLTTYCAAMTGRFNSPTPFEADPDQNRAHWLRLQLLGIGVGTAKSALDRLVGGYYSQALADVRHMAETAIHGMLLFVRPDTARRWYSSDKPQKEPIAPKDAVPFIVEWADNNGLPGMSDRAKAALSTWRLGHSGAHPSPDGITQTVLGAADGTFMFGPSYNEKLSYIAFDNGLWAVALLTELAVKVSPREAQLSQELNLAWDDSGNWRERVILPRVQAEAA